MGLTSAGIRVYRRHGARTEFLLRHPGGPMWVRSDIGAWMIPKGVVDRAETPLAATRREFEEKTAPAWARPMIGLSDVLSPVEAKRFDLPEEAAAWAWIDAEQSV